MIGKPGFVTDIHQQKTARAKRTFHLPGLEACLPKQCSLLIDKQSMQRQRFSISKINLTHESCR